MAIKNLTMTQWFVDHLNEIVEMYGLIPESVSIELWGAMAELRISGSVPTIVNSKPFEQMATRYYDAAEVEIDLDEIVFTIKNY